MQNIELLTILVRLKARRRGGIYGRVRTRGVSPVPGESPELKSDPGHKAPFGPGSQSGLFRGQAATCNSGLATNLISSRLLVVKNHWFAWRANLRETHFFSVLPSNSLVSVLYPWRAFWADTALHGPSTRFVPCFPNYRDTKSLPGVPC